MTTTILSDHQIREARKVALALKDSARDWNVANLARWALSLEEALAQQEIHMAEMLIQEINKS